MKYEIRDDVPPPQMKLRHTWPFARMKTGNFLVIEFDNDWLPALKGAHSVAFKKGWKFTGKWDKHAKNAQGEPWPHGKIWRVE